MNSDSSPNSGWLSTSSLLLSISVGRSFGSPPNNSYHNPWMRMRYYGRCQHKKKCITACDCHIQMLVFWVVFTFGLLQFETIFSIRLFRSSILGMLNLGKKRQMGLRKKNWNMNRKLHNCSFVYSYNNRVDSNIVSITL